MGLEGTFVFLALAFLRNKRTTPSVLLVLGQPQTHTTPFSVIARLAAARRGDPYFYIKVFFSVIARFCASKIVAIHKFCDSKIVFLSIS